VYGALNPKFANSNPLIPPVDKSLGRYTNLGGPAGFIQQALHTQVNDRITVSFQRQLPSQIVFEATYFANLGFNAPYTRDLNQIDPQITYQYKAQITKAVPNPFYRILTPALFPGQLRNQEKVTVQTLLKPYPQYTAITQDNTAGGLYRLQSLKLRAQRGFRNGFHFLATYAYLRKNTSRFFNADDQYANVFTLQPTTEPRHRLNVAGTYTLPLGRGRKFLPHLPAVLDAVVSGWSSSSILRYQGGSFLEFGQLKVLGDAKLDHPTPDRWFDTSQFQRADAYTQRTNAFQLGIRGPRFFTMDTTLAKNFRISEKIKLEFRMEAYNLTNSIMFGSVDTNIDSASFGRTTSQINRGREMQYLLRLRF
jgi:hypothetical protein